MDILNEKLHQNKISRHLKMKQNTKNVSYLDKQ
jgi:hypothetical protein